MRWLVALALVVVALVVMIVRVATKRPQPILADDEEEVSPTSPDRAPTTPADPPSSSASPTPKPAAARATVGVSVIKGRVLLSGGGAADREDLADFDVSARELGGHRQVTARTSHDGRYTLRLPPGRYEIIASDGDLVGIAPDIELEADREREVDILLGPGATISGIVRGPTETVTLETVPAGQSSSVAGEFSDVDDTFSVGGLIPGRRYDLVFAGRAIRRKVVAAIAAPAEGLEVVLSALPVVRGAVGFARGETCPIESVHLRTGASAEPDDSEDDGAQVAEDCRFELPAPDGAAEVTVVATGPGWHLEEKVAIPPTGDPPPICLNPPCRDNPSEGLASLRVTFEGRPSHGVGDGVTAMVGKGGRSLTCSGSGDTCEITGITPERTLVTARADGCATEARTLDLTPGSSSVTFPCRRLRRIEGLVRRVGAGAEDDVAVRCRGGETQYLSRSRLFQLQCAADVSDLEYRLGDGPWRRAPVPAGGDDALVEITL